MAGKFSFEKGGYSKPEAAERIMVRVVKYKWYKDPITGMNGPYDQRVLYQYDTEYGVDGRQTIIEQSIKYFPELVSDYLEEQMHDFCVPELD